MPIPTPGTGPCGLWLPTNDCDYVLHEANTSPPHQVHIALHELGHLIFDHDGISPYSEEFLRRALPNLDPAAVRRVLSRAAYTVQQEAEAELLATMIGERGITAATAKTGSPADVEAQLERLNDALGTPSPRI